jgi:hypothetical protein
VFAVFVIPSVPEMAGPTLKVATPLTTNVVPTVAAPAIATRPEALIAAAVSVPVVVGLADIITLPVPVIALETRPFEPSENTGREAVRLDRIGWAVRVATPVTAKVVPTVSAPETVKLVKAFALINWNRVPSYSTIAI